MRSLLLVLVPLLAVWLCYPLWRWSRRALLVGVVLTTVLGLLPTLLIVLMRNESLSFDVIAHAQLWGGWVFGALVLALAVALVRDGLWALLTLARQRKAAAALLQPHYTLGGMAAALLLSGYGIYQGTRVPQVREQTVTLQRLPAALDGLRVAVLADLHATPINNAAYIQAVVERTNAAQPDMVVLPGDLVDGDAATQRGNIAPLAQLHAPLGVWSAPGNHEYYSGYDAWAQVYRSLNLHYLANEARVLEVRGHKLAISGVGDPAYGRLSRQNTDPHVPEGPPPDIAAVAQQARDGGAEVLLLLGHQPKMARSYAPYGVDLQIAGHTHGGHILGMDRWVVAPANDGFVRGLYTVGPMQLFVSSGAGLWPGFALRLGVPSAIDVLVLRSPQP